MTMERKRPVSVESWLAAEWAIKPNKCRRCSVPMSVAWLLYDVDYGRSQWMSMCHTHGRLHLVTMARAQAALVVIEAKHGESGLVVYQAPDRLIEPWLLSWAGDAFARLDHARKTWARKPGKLRVIREPDGSMWLPWDPFGHDRHGNEMPLRRAELRESKRRRKCVICKCELTSGAAWRPQPGALERGREPWSARALTDVLVCDACVESASRPERPRLRLVAASE